MLTAHKLADFDATFEREPFARVVSELQMQPGGVDPLGLRQLNLDLMDWALPGINNVTSLIRPYVLMAWAWWKAAQVAQLKTTEEVSVDTLRGMVDRIETVFIWSHLLVGQPEGLPGRFVLGRSLPHIDEAKPYAFFGRDWERLRKERRANTSLMSAVQYGPSIRVLEGIGWLASTKKGAFVPVDDVMPAVIAFDRAVSPHLPATLTRFADGKLTARDAAKLHSLWSTGKPTGIEKRVFREAFFGRGDGAHPTSREFRRRSTLSLIFAVLQGAKHPLDIPTIRRMMFSGRTSASRQIGLTEELAPAHRCWIALQARQLQRISLEALLVWIEQRIDQMGGTADAPSLSAEANRLAGEYSPTAYSRGVRAFRKAIDNLAKPYGWPVAAGLGGKCDLFSLADELLLAQQNREFDSLPSLSLRGIGISAAITDALIEQGEGRGPDDLLGGPVDRLPLALASLRLERLSDAPMPDLWREIIESWVLAQHVRWSVARSGDETQRLRIAVDEGGWVRLRSKLSGPFRLTPDRLSTALSLSANCGLVRSYDGEIPLYGVA